MCCNFYFIATEGKICLPWESFPTFFHIFPIHSQICNASTASFPNPSNGLFLKSGDGN